MKLFPRSLVIILLIGLLLRLITALWSFESRENPDVLRYRDWGRIAYLHGLSETYTPDYLHFGTLPNNQPPGSLYMITSLYHFNIQASKVILKVTGAKEGSLQWINGSMLNMSLRLPSMIADLLLAYLIYTVVTLFSKTKHALFASSLFLFNPVVIYNSSFWGQMDSINNLFFYISLFFLLKNRIFWSILFFLLSLYTKLSLIYLFPFLLLFLFIQGKSYKKILLSIAASFCIICTLTFPVSLASPVWLWNFIFQNGLGEMQHITNFAFNGWWFIFMPLISIGKPLDAFNFGEIRLHFSPIGDTIFAGIPLIFWSGILVGIFFLYLLLLFLKNFKKNLKADHVFLVLSVAVVIGFLFLPRMHERYLYPLFPLLATYIGLKKRFLWIYVFLSFLNLINLYLVWHPSLPPIIPYDVMTNRIFQWSISAGVTIVGLLFYFKSTKLLQK